MGNVSHISASTRPILMLLVLILFAFTPLIHSNHRMVDCYMVSSSLSSWKVESSNVNNDDASHPLSLLSLAFQTSLWCIEECKCYQFDPVDCCLLKPASHPVDSSFFPFPPFPFVISLSVASPVYNYYSASSSTLILRHRSFTSVSPFFLFYVTVISLILLWISSLRHSFLPSSMPSSFHVPSFPPSLPSLLFPLSVPPSFLLSVLPSFYHFRPLLPLLYTNKIKLNNTPIKNTIPSTPNPYCNSPYTPKIIPPGMSLKSISSRGWNTVQLN